MESASPWEKHTSCLSGKGWLTLKTCTQTPKTDSTNYTHTNMHICVYTHTYVNNNNQGKETISLRVGGGMRRV